MENENTMAGAVQQILQSLEVPCTYVAYPCLLHMAERYGEGEPLTMELLMQEAAQSSHTYFALRKSLNRIAWAAYSHPEGRKVLGPIPRGDVVWGFLEGLFAAAERR